MTDIQSHEYKVNRCHVRIMAANRDMRKYARLLVVAQEKGLSLKAERYQDMVDRAKREVALAKEDLAELGEEFDDSHLRR